MTGPARGRGRAAVLVGMDREWAALQDDDRAAARCGDWAGRHPPLEGCRRPEDVLQRVAGSPDEVLLALLEEAAGGDTLAGRVVLQALLPKVVLMAALDPLAEVDDYVTALWCEVAAYPVRRRCRSVAANLALDTLKAVRRERVPARDLTVPPDLVVVAADRRRARAGEPGAASGSGATAEVVLRLAREHRLVDPGTRDLLHSVYVDGLPGAAAGRRHGLTPTAVRSRCSRAVHVLARHAVLLADAS